MLLTAVPLAVSALTSHAHNVDVIEAALECLVALSTSEHNRVSPGQLYRGRRAFPHSCVPALCAYNVCLHGV